MWIAHYISLILLYFFTFTKYNYQPEKKTKPKQSIEHITRTYTQFLLRKWLYLAEILLKLSSARSTEKQSTSQQPWSVGAEDRSLSIKFPFMENFQKTRHFLVFWHSCLPLVTQTYRRSLLPVTEILPFLSLAYIILYLVKVRQFMYNFFFLFPSSREFFTHYFLSHIFEVI